MHGSFEPVGEVFLKKVTLWWGCAFTLAVYVAQVGSLAMIAIGLCYVVLARDGAMTSVTAPNVWRPRCARPASLRSLWQGCRLLRCRRGLAELLLHPDYGRKGDLARAARRLHRDLRVGVMLRYGGIKRALQLLMGRAPIKP